MICDETGAPERILQLEISASSKSLSFLFTNFARHQQNSANNVKFHEAADWLEYKTRIRKRIDNCKSLS
jgi:hypothetical protein